MRVSISEIAPRATDTILDLAAEVFASGSTLHSASGISSLEYRACLEPAFIHNVAQGLSVIARVDGKVWGALIACDIRDQGTLRPDARLRPMQSLMHSLEDAYLEEFKPKVGEVVLVDMAFVHPDAAGQGIYTRLRKSAQSLAATRGFKRVVGLLSSAATQNVVVGKLGHRCLSKQQFSRFEFEGSRPFAEVSHPKEIWLTEGHLT